MTNKPKYFETRTDSLEDSVKNIFKNTIDSDQNKFNEAAKAATDAGKEYFVVNGVQHKTPIAESMEKPLVSKKLMAAIKAVKNDEDREKLMAACGGGGGGAVSGDTVSMPSSYNWQTNEAKEIAKEITDKQKKLPKALQAAIKKKEMSEDNLDKVNPKAVKKKFDDRKDKDIDNDGDVDSSDKFLHKRRKAISKAVKSEEKSIVEIQQEKNLSMREMLAKIWGIDEGKSPFATEEAPKKKSGKTESGQKATNVSVNPELAPVVQTQIVPNADR